MTMSKPKPGDEITYTADTERTGIVLDRAPGVSTFWVHREDGTFDKVRIISSGYRKGVMEWLGQYTVSGEYLGQAYSQLA
jgi:hypothetical protein